MKRLFTFKLSKLITSVILIVSIGLFSYLAASQCRGSEQSSFLDIPCFLAVLGIYFTLVLVVLSILMKWKELITFRLSKFLASFIPAVLVGMLACFTVRCCKGPDYFSCLNIPCFLLALGILFSLIWVVFSIAKICKLTNTIASIISIILIILFIFIWIYFTRVIY